MKIYTKTGDDGTTSLFAGGRVRKTHLRVEAYGTVDELNSVIGLARTHQPHSDQWLAPIQAQLFHLGADLATPLNAKSDWIVRMDAATIQWLEKLIDDCNIDLPQLTNFVLPGGTPAAAQLHVARTICRRAERLTVALAEESDIGDHVLPYLNRLSDALFTLARWENHKAGISESKWAVR